MTPTIVFGAGRPPLYYTAAQMKLLFPFSLSHIYKHAEEFGGRAIAGKLCFPRVIVDRILAESGALEPVK